MSLKHHIVLLRQSEELVVALHHLACRPREHEALIIVAVSIQRVHPEVLPSPAENLVPLLEERLEVHQNGNRFAWHHPAAHPHRHTIILGCTLAPLAQQRLALFKKRIFLAFPEVRADEKHTVRNSFLQSFSTR